jgi:hypothetical protein
MPIEDFQDRPIAALARFCTNVVNDSQANAAIRNEALALSKEWIVLASKRASPISVEDYQPIEAAEESLRKRTIEFLARLSDALIKRTEL